MSSENKFSNLPEFPEMRALMIEDCDLFFGFSAKFPPYSDFNFISLWGYDTQSDCEIAAFKDNLIIRMRDYITGEPLYTFVGDSNIKETILLVFKTLGEKGERDILKLFPEICIKNIEDPESIYIQEDRDSFDYIYSIKKLAELKGGAMHKIKNYVNRFKVLYPDVKANALDITKKEIQDEILQLFDLWQKDKEDAQHERVAIVRTLISADKLPKLQAMGLRDKGRLIAFIIFDNNHHDYAQGHFTKALTLEYKGVYPYLYNMTAQFLDEKGIQFFNLEQDLGIEGLRKTKEQLKQEFFLKKYIVMPQKPF